MNEQTAVNPTNQDQGTVEGKARRSRLLEFLTKYDASLKSRLTELHPDTVWNLVRVSNPHIACGAIDAYICADGALALFENLLPPAEDCVRIQEAADPSLTMVHLLNKNAELLHSFFDPISKVSVQKGQANFDPSINLIANSFTLIISEHPSSRLLPFCSKVWMLGWDFLQGANAETIAEESLNKAFALSNLESQSRAHDLVTEFRRLLDTAGS